MRAFEPTDLFQLASAGDPRISPDGSSVAFVVTTLDEEHNSYATQIWIAPIDAAEDRPSRPLTSGRHREQRPRWSPDGRRVAYVAHRGDTGCELMILDREGGEPSELLRFEEEIEEMEWSPDSKRLAFLARDRDEGRYGEKKPKDQPARRITRVVYRLDNVGWTIDRPKQLWVIEPSAADPTHVQLTFGEKDVNGVSWSPDGTEIVFASARHDTWDLDLSTDLFVIPASGGEPERLTQTGSSYSSPSWSPDSDAIAFEWSPSPAAGPFHGRVGVIDRRTKETRILTADLDLNASPYPAVREPIWSKGNIYFSVEDSGNLHVYRVVADGSAPPKVVHGGACMIVGLDVRDEVSALVKTEPTNLPSLFVVVGEGGPGTAVMPEVMRDRLAGIRLAEPIGFTATSADGTQVEAWVVPPSELEEGTRYPALLNIHGGPFTQYGNKFFDEFHCYSGAGYAVIYTNPRGSSGHSEQWGRAIRGPKTEDAGSGWGGVDYEDLMAVTEEALKRFPFIDPERVGVMGGSYGGYMTSWIIGHTDRFKAAISERAVNNMLTQCYTSDVGSYFARELGPSYLEDPEEYRRVSPITYIENMTTPVLIIHSDDDLRCPIEQAEQLFMGLKMLGRDVEFVRFPGEGHELSRSGAPKHRLERFEIVLDWWKRKL